MEWQAWWHEEQEFKEVNRLGKVLTTPPSLAQLQDRYGDDIAKTNNYISPEMYMDCPHSKVLPNIRFC